MSKKKRDTFDEAQEQGVTLEAFVIPQRVDAFVKAYEPCGEQCSTNSFTESRLRDFFKAWPCSLGDPLSIYLTMLEGYGFHLEVSTSGDLAIFTVERTTKSKVLECSAITPQQIESHDDSTGE